MKSLQFFITIQVMITIKRESTVIKYLNDFKAFIEYSNNMDDIYKNIKEGNPNKKRVFTRNLISQFQKILH